MPTHRQNKKIAYAIGFFVFLFLIFGLPILFNTNFSPDPTPIPAPDYLPIAVEQVDIISHLQTTDAVARLKNPNPKSGIGEFAVEFTAFDDTGKIISQKTTTTYILPGSIQYAIALDLPVRNPARVEVTLPSNPQFIDIPAAATMPTFSVFIQDKANKNIGNQLIQEQKGIVRNTSSLDWQRVEIVGLGLDNSGRVVAVGQTFVGELKTSEQREFTVQWPLPASEPNQITVVANTNIYLKENIVKILGDPARLR